MKAALFATAFAMSFAMAGNAPAQTPAPNSPRAPSDNLLAQAARGVGVKQCLPAVERLSALATSGANAHDILVDWDRAQPDVGPFFSMIGMSLGRHAVAATITAVPQGKGGCTISAERISVAPFTCASIAGVELKGYAASRLLPTFTVYTVRGDAGASVSLIDSPPGCLVIRRHVQYAWQEPGSSPAHR